MNSTEPATQMRVVSLFTGVAGLDMGLEQAGLRVVQMCESWAPARRVLSHHYPNVPLAGDVASFAPSGAYDVLAAGFPCTDLSHAGGKAGIFGKHSGLVSHVFRIARETRPRWIALENVPNLLTLHKGAGMRFIVERLEELGYRWAYRTVDSRTTGLPQRRPRVIILAGLDRDPAPAILAGQAPAPQAEAGGPSGFYWTEGRNGLGLVPGAVPTIKGGSTLGLPSAPAVWFPTAAVGHRFVLPGIEDGEALQGLPRGWTRPAVTAGEPDLRWKLVGNAVTVGIGQWLGTCIASLTAAPLHKSSTMASSAVPLERARRWPAAGFGGMDGAWVSEAGPFPLASISSVSLSEVINVSTARPLSHRATSGFLRRLDESGRVVPRAFYEDLEAHQAATRPVLSPIGGSWASSPAARKRMKAQRQRDTAPEMALRRRLRDLGLGYRLQMRPEPALRSRLDIVFLSAQVAVDIRGCFWHSCPQHGTSPRVNAERWSDKLARNVERDRATTEALTELGWQVVVVWEHDDPSDKAEEIAELVRARRAQRARSRKPVQARHLVAAATHGAVPHRVTAIVDKERH